MTEPATGARTCYACGSTLTTLSAGMYTTLAFCTECWPTCPDPGTPCVCCRQPCEGYRQSVPAWAQENPPPAARDAAW